MSIGCSGGSKTSISASTYLSLRQEDSSWDFRGEFTKQLTHGFHSYPAMMIPQVARRLIENYSKPGDTILDPFCGSGSVLVESVVLGRHSWGVDLNPVAILVAKAKTTPIDPRQLDDRFARLLERIDSLSTEDIPVPRLFNLEYWFNPRVATQLAMIKQAMDSVFGQEDSAIRGFFLVSFSDAVRLSSNSRSHEFKLFRYSPEQLKKHNPDPVDIFSSRTRRNIERMREFYWSCEKTENLPLCRTILRDTTACIPEIPDDSVDTVVTSPPYGDSRTTVAYGQFSRLSAQWLGYDETEARNLDTNLLGGRASDARPDMELSRSLTESVALIADLDTSRARQVLSFYLGLQKALVNVARKVKPGGYLCIVIGNRRVKKVQLPTDIIIAEMGTAIGLDPQKIIIRSIPNKTMPLKNSPTNIAGELEPTMHKEHIVILKK